MKENEELKSMSLGDHLEELRARLILALLGIVVGLILSFFVGGYFLKLLLVPFQNAMLAAEYEPQMLAIKVAEKFIVYLKASLVLALLITSPWVFYQIWAFISAGLYKHERRYVRAVSPISAALFIAGTLFFLFIVAPLALQFFVRFSIGGVDWIEYKPQLSEYVNFILVLSLVFGLAFQSPIAIVFAERMGLVTIDMLAKNRKIIILALFIIAAVATPPDVISQILLAIPLYILYESSIVVCRIWRRKREIRS